MHMFFLLLNDRACLQKIIGFLRKFKAIILNKNMNYHIIQVAQGQLNNFHNTTFFCKMFVRSLRCLYLVMCSLDVIKKIIVAKA